MRGKIPNPKLLFRDEYMSRTLPVYKPTYLINFDEKIEEDLEDT